MHNREICEQRTLRAGATAYVSKEDGIDVLISALEEAVFPAAKPLLNRHLDPLTERDSRLETNTCSTACLTDRELEIFRLIGKGKSTRHVSATLHLSVKTIESYRAKIKKKLGLETPEA